MAFYLLQENGSRLLLSGTTGALLLEDGTPAPVADTHDGAWSLEAMRRYRRRLEALRDAEADLPDTRDEIRRQLEAIIRPAAAAEAPPAEVVKAASVIRRQVARPMVDYRPALAALERMEGAIAAYQAMMAEEDDIEVLLLA